MVNVLNPNRHERATNYKFGLGLQYDLTDSLGVRAEVELYRIDDPIGNKGDIDLVSVGLLYRLRRENSRRSRSNLTAACRISYTCH